MLLTIPRSVLVVDDDPLVRDVLADMPEDLGCEVISAANGSNALDHLRQNGRWPIEPHASDRS
jgi:CheY-like chemotaxis protein